MPRKQSVRSNRVVFTLNNYTEEECQTLKKFCTGSNVSYSIVGKEKGKKSTPHLQGFVHLKTSFLRAKDGNVSKWKSLCPALQRAHLESAFGTDEDSKEYCSKDNDLLLEHGTPTKPNTIWEDLCRATSMEEAMKIDPESFVRFHTQLEKITARNAELPELAPKQLYQWQINVLRALKKQGPRQVLFVVDVVGGKGKSELTKWMLNRWNAFCTTGGKVADLQHIFIKKRSCRFAVFDMARNRNPDYYPWDFIEMLKNGWFTSTKYDGKTVGCGSQKIVVFMNFDPPRDKLSEDRYNVLKLNEIDRTLYDVPEDLLE